MRDYIFALLFICLLGAPTILAQTHSYQTPSDLLWKKRILVLCDLPEGAVGAAFFDTMVKRLDTSGLEDRELFLVHALQKPALEFWVPFQTHQDSAALNDSASHDAYTKLARCRPGVTELVLIGKDGGLKQRWKTAPTDETIYNLIDAMPMRMQEMRRSK